ncbi:hypothetical protein [Spirosoma radiotolerans]|uniref:Uncharacterized protein n=1 Tax=Spirosoma radiotolerans TaxID=1379870 RepID=A0A0E3ZS91_9BACT|nr:hypothetical protein [Spirosoma radiotolerans]AKD54019.1 hypothetical protein SD10_02980 [Spirosoma radiotolerans]
MTRSEPINDILKRKDYRHLNSSRLKPTPDLTYPVPVSEQDDLEEAKLLLDYEQQLQDTKNQRGY